LRTTTHGNAVRHGISHGMGLGAPAPPYGNSDMRERLIPFKIDEMRVTVALLLYRPDIEWT